MEKRAVPLGAARGEYEVNRSRFIAAAGFAPSPEEALAFVEEERRRYPDATHHCWAYRMDEGIYRWSDDGEPGGTAGSQILAMIAAAGLCRAVCVVTRYFGGVKLGTGGLARAYSRAANAAILSLETGFEVELVRAEARCAYPMQRRVRDILLSNGAKRLAMSCLEDVAFSFELEPKAAERLASLLPQLTQGSASWRELGRTASVERGEE